MQVRFSPSLRTIVTVVVLIVAEPPFALVTEQETPSNAHPDGMGVSSIVKVPSARMLPNNFVFAEVPLSTSEKALRGEGDAVNGKLVAPLGVASLMIVIDAGKNTAAADSERSWLPPDPSRSSNRVWYGEPEMAMAEFAVPQSCRVAMWPPHARTGLAWVAVKLMTMLADLSPVKPAPLA